MSTPTAQITIAGALEKEHIATLVEVALAAGAALMVQPRPLPAPSSADVVDSAPSRRRALPPASKRVARKGPTVRRRVARPVDEAVLDRARRALRDGPLPPSEFRRGAKISVHEARKLVAVGAIVATGVTHGRRYALPGASAKEAP